MRIGLLIYDSLEIASGGYLYDRKAADYFKRQGHHIEVIAIPSAGYLRNIRDNFDPRLENRLIKAEIDVLVQDELNHPSLFLLNERIRQVVNYPILGIIHHLRCAERNNFLDQRIANYIEKRYLRSLDGWIAVSHTTLANVERLAADEQRPFVVAHPSGKRWENTPSISEVRARAQQPGPLRIVFLANLIPRKGLHVLLSALRSLPRDAWQLAVIGGSHMNSAYMERIRKIIGEYRLDDNLNLTGWINTQELASALREHHLLVVPSSYEGFGLVYLEGMGLGLPAIASTQGAAHEIITHGKNGYLLEYGDVQALAQTIYILHTDRTLLAQISENALAHYAGTPSWEDTGAKLLDFITAQAKR